MEPDLISISEVQQNIQRIKYDIDQKLKETQRLRSEIKGQKPELLSKDERQMIIDSIPRVYSADIGNADLARRQIQDRLNNMLQQPINKIVKAAIPDLIKEINHKFERSRIEAGQAVGLLAAQAIAAQLMQSTLNTFHKSGSGTNISAGINAYKDMLQLPKEMKNPNCNIYFKDIVNFDTVIKEKRPDLEYVTVYDVVKSTDIVLKKDLYDDLGNFKEVYYYLYNAISIMRGGIDIINFVKKEEVSGPSFLRLYLNVDYMFKQKISPEDVCEAMMKGNEDNILCIPSPIIMVPETKSKMYYNTSTNLNEYHDITTNVPYYYIDIYTYIDSVLKEVNDKYNIDSRIITSWDALKNDQNIWKVYYTPNENIPRNKYFETYLYYGMKILGFTKDANGEFFYVVTPEIPDQAKLDYSLVPDPRTNLYYWSPSTVIDYIKRYGQQQTDESVLTTIESEELDISTWTLFYDSTVMDEYNISRVDIFDMMKRYDALIVNNLSKNTDSYVVFQLPPPSQEAIQTLNLVPVGNYYLWTPMQFFDYHRKKESRESINNIYFNTIIVPKLENVRIKGVEGIKSLYPEKISVWSAIDEEVSDRGNNWTLRFNKVRMRQTGITPEHIRNLCKESGMTINEFNESEKDKFYYDYLKVIMPKIPDDARKTLNIKPDMDFRYWKPKQVINYYKIKELDANLEYAKNARHKREDLINQGRVEEADEISTVKPPSSFENALDFIYAMTEGTNLKDLLLMEEIDPDRTISNNIHEILQNYGIEAARTFLAEHLYNIVLANENYINPRHPLLIAEHITRMGFLTPITLTGIKKNPTGFLTKAGHSKPAETLKSAALTGKRESLSTTYQSLMTGKLLSLGTGIVNVSLNKKLENELYEKHNIADLYGITADSLAKEMEEMEMAQNDMLVNIDDLEEDSYFTIDDNNHVLATTSPIPKPVPLSKAQISPGIIAAMPEAAYGQTVYQIPTTISKPVKSDSINKVAFIAPSSPTVERDIIEDVSVKPLKIGIDKEEFQKIGVESVDEYVFSTPIFTEGAGGMNPNQLAQIFTIVQRS